VHELGFRKIRAMRKKLLATCRLNVAKLADSETDCEGRTPKKRYLQGVLEKASDSWMEKSGAAEQWQSICGVIVSTAAGVLGISRHRQLDWFVESFQGLKP